MSPPPGVETEVRRRLHPLTPVLGVFDRGLVAPAVLGLTAGQLRLLLLGVVVLGGLAVLRWWRRTWSFDGGVLRLEAGVLARSQQVVPAERVQQVTVVRHLRHRLLGLASLRVEVAGGGSGVELDALGADEAARLRTALLAGRERRVPAAAPVEGVASEAPAWVPAPWPVVRLGFGDLALAGVTGAQLFVVFAFVGSAVELLDVVPGELSMELRDVEVGAVGPLVVLLGIALALAVVLGLAVGASVLRDGGFELDLIGDELHLRRGLLDRKEAVLPLARVQAVRVTASPLQRLAGVVSLRVQGAGRGTDQEERRVVVPILRSAEVDRVVGVVLPGVAGLPTLGPAPPAARRRALVRSVAPATVLALPLLVLAWPWWPGLVLVLGVALLGGAALGLASYRALGHARLPDALVSRTGAVVRRTVVVPHDRAQSVRVRASPFQRRAGLATLAVDLAGPGRSPLVVDEREATAASLAGWLAARR